MTVTTPVGTDWSGRWVSERCGVRLTGSAELPELVGLALRRNPRRAHLLVSTVLGKHIPADPRLVLRTGQRLGRMVADAVGDRSAVVLGFAETATGLGHTVADELSAPYLHSTRRQVPTVRPYATFAEPHSHATGHLLLPADDALFTSNDTLVVVDDEISTGVTARNTITALHALRPRTHYVIAALVDVRAADQILALDEFAASLGAQIDVVALATGRVTLPADLAGQAAGIGGLPRIAAGAEQAACWHRDLWPRGVRESGRHGFTPADSAAARSAAADVAGRLAAALGPGRVLVLGTEELMHVPTLIAAALADRGREVRVSATTRSPVAVVDEIGYPVRAGVSFPSSDRQADEPGPRFVYNVVPGSFDQVVLVVDQAADSARLRTGLVASLAAVAPSVHVVVLPTWTPLPEPLSGPRFGSYDGSEVQWLLTDLSHAPLEAPIEDREEAIQSGGAHYAESLPVEYQPDGEYLQLFASALAESAERIAIAVGIVTELLLAERGRDIVLASLARAGTPVGILLHRWARFAHDVDLPHYAISIVRGRGLDPVALRWLAERHDPAQVAFVDGWTGKGAIVRELTAAVEQENAILGVAFDPALAVLADPGSCVRTFGTRADFLIPSACLNSTVSGLVSRTVLNPDLLDPGQFHGAKFYRELAAADVSARFLDAVSERFAGVADEVLARWPAVQAGDREPTWSGWAEVERISREYGIGDATLVKPGVGETTRVLLRRVPWAVLVRRGAGREVAHVLLLAERRGVPVYEVEGLAYRCVGLIHPRYTRAATGADGRAAARP